MTMLETFLVTLVMMTLNATAKIMIRDYRNKLAVMLTGMDTFIFVMLISDNGTNFAIAYTLARIVGVAIVMGTVNKRKEYIQSITIITNTEVNYKAFVKDLQRLDYKYFARDIETKNLFSKEVIVISKTKEKSKNINTIIPKDSLVIRNETNHIEMI